MIGVFGGTFDPPHLGHLILAAEGAAELGLERVLWVVTGDPPHKPDRAISPAEVRVEMVERAIRGDGQFALSRADLDRPQPHYTVGTLRWLREYGVDGPLAYLMGSDSLVDLPQWQRPAEFVAACDRIGVLRRPGSQVDWDPLQAALPGLRDKVHFFDAPNVGISGQDIRARVAAGRPYRYFVLPRVAEVIEQRELYR